MNFPRLILIGQRILTHHLTCTLLFYVSSTTEEVEMLRHPTTSGQKIKLLPVPHFVTSFSSSSSSSYSSAPSSTTLSLVRWRSWMHLLDTSTRCRFELVMRWIRTVSGASGAPWWLAGRGKVRAAAVSLSRSLNAPPPHKHTHTEPPTSLLCVSA